MKPRDYVPSGLFGLWCAGCQKFVVELQLVSRARYRCNECAKTDRGVVA